uniref:glutathione transferase n=1 Tax=Dermanyssus gallinae TaxID=34641 RepID=A0A0H4FNI7_9ACAR|nr:glutathione S-transferases-1 [Dermanyssus gallinae]BEQ23838.1 glutathione S-transferase-1 [Dermanyssus gallinae]
MAPSTTFGYWNIRGLAQPIRNLLEYVGEEYENVTYDFDTSDMSNVPKVLGKWPEAKTSCPKIVGGDGEVAMDFPNLPYFIEKQADGTTLKMTQSVAILKHIARKHGLVVEGELNVARMEMLEEQAMDLKQAIAGYCYDHPMTSFRYPNYTEDIQAVFKQWDKVLEGHQFVMGDKLTYVDFLLFEFLDWHLPLKADIFDATPNVKAFLERFRSLPKIAEYFASSRYQSWPLVSPFAKKFGWTKGN